MVSEIVTMWFLGKELYVGNTFGLNEQEWEVVEVKGDGAYNVKRTGRAMDDGINY